MLKKLTNLLLLCLLLLSLCSCGVLKPKPTPIVYKDVPLNTIAVNRGAIQLYSWDEWMIVKRSTYQRVWDMLTDRDAMLDECLRREKTNQ